MGSLSTLLFPCLQRKQRQKHSAATRQEDEHDRPPVPAKDAADTEDEKSSVALPAPAVTAPTYKYTYTYRQSEKHPFPSEPGTGDTKPDASTTANTTKLTKRSSIRIVNSRDSDSERTLVSSPSFASTSTSTSTAGQTLGGSRTVSRSGSEKDIEAGGGRTASAIIEAGLEDLERQMRTEPESTGLTRSRSLPEIKSRVIEDIPEEDEMGTWSGHERPAQGEKDLPCLPKEVETGDREETTQSEDKDEEKGEEEELTSKTKSLRDSLRLSSRKSLIEMVQFLQPPTNRLSGLKLPSIPPRSPLRKRASASMPSSPSDPRPSPSTSPSGQSPPSSPTDPDPKPEEESKFPTPRTKKHRRMGAVGMGMGLNMSMGLGLPLRVRRSVDEPSSAGKKSTSLFC